MTRKLLLVGLLLLGSLVMLFPLWWMLCVSFSTPAQASAAATSGSEFNWVPNLANWGNYPDALRQMGVNPPAAISAEPPRGWLDAALRRLAAISRAYRGFLDALANTIVVTVLSVIGQVLSCSLVGYAFARLRFRGRTPMFIVMIATMMLPAQVTMIPMFILFRWFGWIDTILPLVVPLFFGTPFYIFMFRQFFAQVPEALVEAARIDGCGYLRTWWTIMLPLCRPVIVMTAVFTFMFAWNDFLGPLIYLQSEDQYTLAIALNSFRNQYGGVNQVHLLMAASIVTMLPCILLFFVAQKQFVGGLQLGAVKG